MNTGSTSAIAEVHKLEFEAELHKLRRISYEAEVLVQKIGDQTQMWSMLDSADSFREFRRGINAKPTSRVTAEDLKTFKSTTKDFLLEAVTLAPDFKTTLQDLLAQLEVRAHPARDYGTQSPVHRLTRPVRRAFQRVVAALTT